MVTPVQTGTEHRKGHFKERLYIYTGLAHCFKKTVFDMQRTHMIIDHPHGDSGPSPLHQDVCYFLADCIIFKDIVLKMDKLTRR